MTRIRISLVLGIVAALGLVACSSDEPSASTGGSTVETSGTDQAVSTTAVGPPSTGGTATTTTSGSTVGSTAGSSTSTTGVTVTTVPRVVEDPSDFVRAGDTGPGVQQIQYVLIANGYNIEVDGEFGPVTEAAVKGFQKKNGLKEDGVVGPVTWARLQASVGTSTTSAGTTADSTTSTT